MIPVFEPLIGEEEIRAVVEALRRGEISGSFGRAIEEFERDFAEYCGCRHGIAVTSGTTALHLAVAAAGIGAGDEVLVSASTNIATALAVYHHGAVTVPVDSEDATWNLDLDRIDGLLSPRTKAILPVHLYGHPVYMPRVMEIARSRGLLVIEDCAQAHGALCDGRKAGSFGDMSCFSFYANKIITTGEGGMIVTNDARLAEKMRYLRNLAFGEPRFLHREAGHNFRMTGYQAAMGHAQLPRIESILEGKRRIARTYGEGLAGCRFLQLPTELPWARNVYWMYAVVVKPDSGLRRDDLIAQLKSKGIETRTFFCPMNLQPFLRVQPGHRDVPCPVADRLWETGLYLPSSLRLTDPQIQTVCEAIRSFGR